MIGILIVSHGTLSSHLIKSAEMIMGDQEDLLPIELKPCQGLEDIKASIKDAYQKLNNGKGILVLADLQGGTPCNGAFMMLNDYNMSIVSGVNLPMLLEVLINRKTKSLDELTDIAIRSGKEGVKNISNLYIRK